MFKKCIAILIFVVLLFTLSTQAAAAEVPQNPNEYNEYLGYVQQGILGEDVTFDDWKYLKNKASELEAALEASSEFDLIYDSTNPSSTYSTYTLTKGDVFITNGTSSAGITGHAGIAASNSQILHIAGFGYNPTKISLSTWHTQYTNNSDSSWTKIYRHSSCTVANQAANWAVNTYDGSSAVYSITQDVSTTYETYCSKLVWQAYFYGANSATYLSSGYILPYSLPDLITNISLTKTF